MPKLLRSAVLVAGAWCAGTAAAAQQTLRRRRWSSSRFKLCKPIGAVQAQMKQLADQNQALQQKELDLERQFAQVSRQRALPGRTAAGIRGTSPSPRPRPRLWGYGELYYTRPTRIRTGRRPTWRAPCSASAIPSTAALIQFRIRSGARCLFGFRRRRVRGRAVLRRQAARQCGDFTADYS